MSRATCVPFLFFPILHHATEVIYPIILKPNLSSLYAILNWMSNSSYILREPWTKVLVHSLKVPPKLPVSPIGPPQPNL